MSNNTSTLDPLTAFQWKQQPETAAWVNKMVGDFVAGFPVAACMAGRMRDEAGTRFLDWVDTIFISGGEPHVSKLREVGYEPDPLAEAGLAVWWQPHGVFPRVVLQDASVTKILLKVDSVATFLATNDIQAKIEGEPLGQLRMATVAAEGKYALGVVERHGHRGYEIPKPNAEKALLAVKALDAFRTRKRDFATDEQSFAHANDLVDAYIKPLGVAWVCDLFFEAERQYWMKRNRAAQVQYARQQKIGLGWANHDHHTYRSSRRHFAALVGLWEKLGFNCRERYHAGMQAGWGAQVMEDPITGITTFNDVDLSPEELFNDFAHDAMSERDTLGTVGLWCALHGEAVHQSGMHHLECMFDFDALKVQLETESVKTMNPFTNFTYLRQAFTEGERWVVKENRLQALLKIGRITEEQAAQFRTQGAIGSHLENLERNDGFKGFNQKGVSEIISATDPRKQVKQPA
ncbi:MAG TPA: hypothetical protein VFE58_07305 [Tepidisphaeraceae bacterium]|jgi:hypothetical protein|nr:hypothetical protein [Tepidisphaeraceae bacterium]